MNYNPAVSYSVKGNFWTPKQSHQGGEVASCIIPRYPCDFLLHQPWLPPAEGLWPDAGKSDPRRPSPPPVVVIAGVPPFDRKRVVIWYQKDCIACQNSRPVFDAVIQAGATSKPPFSVHEVEATPELLVRFPHVTVVPMYDVVEPDPSAMMAPGPYGPHTRFVSVKNDLALLKGAFPNMVLPAPTNTTPSGPPAGPPQAAAGPPQAAAGPPQAPPAPAGPQAAVGGGTLGNLPPATASPMPQGQRG